METTLDTTILVVRQYLFEELSKTHDSCEIGSNHRDMTYYNYKEAIKIVYRGLLIHIRISTNSLGEIMADVHSPPSNGSYLPWTQIRTCVVDLPAPNFGPLLDTIKSNIEETIQDIDNGELIYW